MVYYDEQIRRMVLSNSHAIQLPRKHCALQRCMWQGDNDDGLALHLRNAHSSLITLAVLLLSYSSVTKTTSDIAILSVYYEAIAIALRQSPPAATCSIDRRSSHDIDLFQLRPKFFFYSVETK